MFHMKSTEGTKKFKELVHSVGAGVVLIGHEVTDIFPFSDSIILDKITEVRDEVEYTVRDVDDKRNKNASKELSAALLTSFIIDVDTFYLAMKKDHRTLEKLTMVLFALVILLLGVILV